VGLQVLRALAAAHELGIVHRDVKPGNVLDAGVGTWKVADFGIAKWIHADETLTGTGELLGSPSYLAPERIEGQQAGPAADLYAVGVLLYEALCGRKPFEGDEPMVLATAIREGRYEPPDAVVPDADPEIVAVIHRAMRRRPGDRYGSAEEMAAALLGDETGDAARPVEAVEAETPSETSSDGTETRTVVIPRPEHTARLPVQTDAAAEAEAARPRAARWRRPPRAVLVVAGAVLAVIVVTVLALSVFSGPDQPSGGGGSSTLPAPLDDALSRLEEAVQL
jgi:serine/threonine protein kinase